MFNNFKIIIIFILGIILGSILGACFYAICMKYDFTKMIILLSNQKNWKYFFYKLGGKWCIFVNNLSELFIQNFLQKL